MLRSIAQAFSLLILLSVAVSAETSLTWSRGPDLALPRGGYSAAVYQEGILVVGGAYWRDGEKLWTDRVDFYDPKTETWLQRPSLPEPLGYGGMVRIEKELYLLGGGNGPQPQRKVFKLTETGWSVVGENPAPRYLASVVAVGSTIYLVAGSLSMNDLDRCTDEVWSLDVTTGGWQRLAPIPGPPRMIQAAAVLGSSVYIFGGSTKETGRRLQNLDDAYRFDTETGQMDPAGSGSGGGPGLVGRTGGRTDLPLRRLRPYVSGNRLRIRSFRRHLHPGFQLRTGLWRMPSSCTWTGSSTESPVKTRAGPAFLGFSSAAFRKSRPRRNPRSHPTSSRRTTPSRFERLIHSR